MFSFESLKSYGLGGHFVKYMSHSYKGSSGIGRKSDNLNSLCVWKKRRGLLKEKV